MDGRILFLKKQFIENLQHHWTVEEMAEAVELSPSHLQKLFKANIGIPPICYLRELRLEKASDLLENTFLRLKQIGVEIGMINDSHFTRDFKKKFGVTPTQYRKNYWRKYELENSKDN
ncbi:MAG: AraC family transcriptional regulator [Acidobacteriota bacterium]|nr:AraC family transcriptional regulator [Acidobacteriota bacterium]